MLICQTLFEFVLFKTCSQIIFDHVIKIFSAIDLSFNLIDTFRITLYFIMKIMEEAWIFLILILSANSEICNNPSGYANFDIDSYASGIWFSTYYQASIQTPLTAPCLYGTSTRNTTHVNLVVTDKTNATAGTFTITAKIVSRGVLKWQVSSMSFKGIAITNIDINVSFFFIAINDFHNFFSFCFSILSFVSIK